MISQVVQANKSREFDKDVFDRAKRGDSSILNDFTYDILSLKYGNDDSTCLHELAKNGVVAINKVPSQYLKIQDNTGRTPIHYLALTNAASQWKNFRQAAYDVQDEDGKTPLHYLAEHFDVSSVPSKYLGIKDYENYNTPVHVMCESNVPFNIAIIPESIMKQQNVLGETPAHLLAYNSNKEFVKCPSQDIKNMNGQTPMDIYEERTKASAEEVTAGIKPYLMKKRNLTVLKTYTDIGPMRFYWDVGGEHKIYTYTFENGDTLSFSLFKKDIRNDLQLPCTYEELPIYDNYIKVFALISGDDSTARDILVDELSELGVFCFNIDDSGNAGDSEEVTASAEVVIALTSKRRKSAAELAKMKIKRRQNRVKLRMQRLRRKNKVKSAKRRRAAKRAHKTRKRLYGK